jgi:hypothetical protein
VVERRCGPRGGQAVPGEPEMKRKSSRD